jgi:hypothetical protein
MRKLFILIGLLLGALVAEAQTITGIVKDSRTGETLPFVNVGIIGKGIGTVTDVQGRYAISLSGHDKDSIRFSMIGYNAKITLISDFKNPGNQVDVTLSPSSKELKEVTVSNHKWKEAVLGNTTRSQTVNAGFTDNTLGHEIGEVIRIKRAPTRLKQFNASISVAATDTIRLRLNIYTVANGLPDENLLQQNIIATVKPGDKMLTINLEPYNIIVNDKFFVSLEWVQSSKGHGLMFSASLLSSAIIVRETSQDKWEKIGLAGVGFNVLAEY